MHLLEQYTSDGVRYWAASARLGTDTAFDEKVLAIGKRLVTKLFNAGKFVLGQAGESAPIDVELDRAFVHRLAKLVAQVTKSYDAFEYAHALAETESFFWHDFTDTYLELVKVRARDGGGGAALMSLRLGLSTLLRLFAPVLPYITDEVWSWAFADETRTPSIHRADWPGPGDFRDVAPPADPQSFDLAVAALAAINKSKSEAKVSPSRGVATVTVRANAATQKRLPAVWDDVKASTRVEQQQFATDDALADGVVEVSDVTFLPAPPKNDG
jgi:valyl-tRNA synthetase